MKKIMEEKIDLPSVKAIRERKELIMEE